MAKYSDSTNYSDEMLTVSASEMEQADTYVESILHSKGIDPADVILPSPPLTQLAVWYASHLAAVANAAGESPELEAKARFYKDLYREAADRIDRDVLGIESGADSGWGSIELGRG